MAHASSPAMGSSYTRFLDGKMVNGVQRITPIGNSKTSLQGEKKSEYFRLW
jgi:hypothetical protein